MTIVTGRSILSPVPPPVRSQEVPEVSPRATLAGKTVGFLNSFWPAYEPLVDELGHLLRYRVEVRATPRLDYWRRPRLSEVWKEGKEWLSQLDAAVVGLGA